MGAEGESGIGIESVYSPSRASIECFSYQQNALLTWVENITTYLTFAYIVLASSELAARKVSVYVPPS